MKLTELEREELRHLQSRKKFLEMLVDDLSEAERAWGLRLKARLDLPIDARVSIEPDGTVMSHPEPA